MGERLLRKQGPFYSWFVHLTSFHEIFDELNYAGKISGGEIPEVRPVETNANLEDSRKILNDEETVWPLDDFLSNFQQQLDPSTTIHRDPQQEWEETVIENQADNSRDEQYFNEGFLRVVVLMFRFHPQVIEARKRGCGNSLLRPRKPSI